MNVRIFPGGGTKQGSFRAGARPIPSSREVAGVQSLGRASKMCTSMDKGRESTEGPTEGTYALGLHLRAYAARALQPVLGMPVSSDKRRLLIVDDQEALTWSLSTRLAKVRPRYHVETAHDGAAALAKFLERPFDLLVADVRMPGMSGIELVLAARQLKAELPVIVMTAFKTVDVLSLTNNSAIQFLEKPFQIRNHFLESGRSLVQRRPAGILREPSPFRPFRISSNCTCSRTPPGC